MRHYNNNYNNLQRNVDRKEGQPEDNSYFIPLITALAPISTAANKETTEKERKRERECERE